MLALAIAMLHDPEVLMIDELSLGLAPIIVQELIEVVEGLKAAGVTLIIVEQSLNVAAAIADRAVFLEKGRVRFAGPIRDLMERDDLARAVFLGGQEADVMLAVSWINSQIVFDGVVQGLAIAVIAVGVVLVYRATRIINFAVGNMGVVGAALLSLLVVQYHVPFWVALGVALVTGLAFGAHRRRGDHPPAAQVAPRRRAGRHHRRVADRRGDRHQDPHADVPSACTTRAPSAASGRWPACTVRGSDLSILIIVPITLVALTWFLDRTTLGKTVKACASNPSLARLSGISPKVVSTMVWALAAGLVDAFDRPHRRPERLGGGRDDPRATDAVAGPGGGGDRRHDVVSDGRSSPASSSACAESILNFNFIAEPGLINLLLLITVLVAVLFNRERTDETEVFAFTPQARPIPVRLQSYRWARNVNKSGDPPAGGRSPSSSRSSSRSRPRSRPSPRCSPSRSAPRP